MRAARCHLYFARPMTFQPSADITENRAVSHVGLHGLPYLLDIRQIANRHHGPGYSTLSEPGIVPSGRLSQ
jgi:hypothetical protein